MTPTPPAAERDVLTVWPSVVATAPGRVLGGLLNCVPLRVGPATVSQYLFGPPLAPVGAAIYLWQKVFGLRYRLTDRRLIAEAALTGREVDAVELSEVAAADVTHRRGDRFFRTGNLVVRDATGTRRLTVRGVPHVENLAARLAEVRGSHDSVAAAAATIARRAA